MADGSVAATATGGVGLGYTYSWAPPGGNAATASGLAAGTYTVTLSDANTCLGPASVTLLNPAAAASVASIPTLSQWGMLLLSVMVAGFAALRMKRT